MLIAPTTPGHAAPVTATTVSPIEILGRELQPPSTRLDERVRVQGASLNAYGSSQPATVTGALLPRLSDRRVLLEALTRGHWRVVASARTGARGRFRLSWSPRGAGGWPVQVRFRGGPYAMPAARRLGQLSSYRLAGASWYGGGGTLACGGYLTSATMGVANKTLPCGTMVKLLYHGRSVTVPVIDRGPYVAGREYDLTEATKNALGFEGVGEVWASS